ncbi:hypothetical protein Hanom_Chr03g00201271 [Helianthus anomalus]
MGCNKTKQNQTIHLSYFGQTLTYQAAKHYTGMTSGFDESSHLKTMPSKLAGSIHVAHWHPVGTGSGGGTIINTLSFL